MHTAYTKCQLQMLIYIHPGEYSKGYCHTEHQQQQQQNKSIRYKKKHKKKIKLLMWCFSHLNLVLRLMNGRKHSEFLETKYTFWMDWNHVRWFIHKWQEQCIEIYYLRIIKKKSAFFSRASRMQSKCDMLNAHQISMNGVVLSSLHANDSQFILMNSHILFAGTSENTNYNNNKNEGDPKSTCGSVD